MTPLEKTAQAIRMEIYSERQDRVRGDNELWAAVKAIREQLDLAKALEELRDPKYDQE